MLMFRLLMFNMLVVAPLPRKGVREAVIPLGELKLKILLITLSLLFELLLLL